MFCDWKMENDRTFTLAVPNRLLGDYNWAYPSEVKSQGHGTLKDGVWYRQEPIKTVENYHQCQCSCNVLCMCTSYNVYDLVLSSHCI